MIRPRILSLHHGSVENGYMYTVQTYGNVNVTPMSQAWSCVAHAGRYQLEMISAQLPSLSDNALRKKGSGHVRLEPSTIIET